MRIVHICCANFFRDNCGYQENILPKYHAKLGHETFVIASLVNKDMEKNIDYLDNPRTYQVENYSVTRIPFRWGKIGKSLRMYKDLTRNLMLIKPNVIFVHGVQFYDIRKIKKYIQNNKETKLYIDNHGDYFNGAKTWFSKNISHKIVWKSGAKSIEKYCDKFYGVTPVRCDFLNDMYGINKKKIELLVMGADLEKNYLDKKISIRNKVRKELCFNEDDFVLVTGGRLVNRKNLPELLNAITEIQKTHKKVKLLMFGVMTEDIRKKIEKQLNKSYITYIGWIPAEKVYDYFFASDLGVFPGTHSVLWEQAVGSGLPCIFKRWNGMEHVNIGGNCSFIDGDSSEVIRKEILKIYNNIEIYLEMKEISTTVGINHFSYFNIARRAIEGEIKT